MHYIVLADTPSPNNAPENTHIKFRYTTVLFAGPGEAVCVINTSSRIRHWGTQSVAYDELLVASMIWIVKSWFDIHTSGYSCHQQFCSLTSYLPGDDPVLASPYNPYQIVSVGSFDPFGSLVWRQKSPLLLPRSLLPLPHHPRLQQKRPVDIWSLGVITIILQATIYNWWPGTKQATGINVETIVRN